MVRLWTTLLLVVCAGLSLSPVQRAHGPGPMQAIPPVVLWAWERPTDLRGLPAAVGVAWLAQTVRVSPLGLRINPRRQPLRVDPATPLVAVTRIESDGHAPLASDSGAIREIAEQIRSTTLLPAVRAVQIDFDAVASERAFYRRLIVETHRQLPDGVPLSITALASWCADDRWLADLPIDEAVPMLFQMGSDDERYVERVMSPRGAAACQDAVGVSLEEPMHLDARHRRLYVFSSAGWTDDARARALGIRP